MSARALGLLLCCVSTAAADTPANRPFAIEVDRADAPPGRTELGFDGGAPLDGTLGVTLATGWLEDPIALGSIQPVRRRQTVGIGAAVALGTSIVLDARLSGSHQIGDRLGTRPLDRWVGHDVRAGARIHVVGNATRAAFVRVDAGLPTGDAGDFAGDESWHLSWRLIGRLALPASITLAATAGIRLRGREVLVGDKLLGDEGILAAGIVVPLPALPPLWCEQGLALTAEVAAILGNDVGMGQGPSPVEARLGAITRPTAGITIGVRAGTGLDDEIGAPAFRATVELTYAR